MGTKKSSDTTCNNTRNSCPLVQFGGGSLPYLQPPAEKEINLLDLLMVLLRRKFVIIGITFLSCILSIGYSLKLPEIYTSTGTILPAEEKGGSSSLLASLGGGLGGLAGSLIGGSSQGDLWASILKSRTIAEKIVKRFDLVKVYDADTPGEAIKALGEATKVSKSKKDSIISVSVEDRSPERAAELALAFIEELDRHNRKFSISSGRRMRVFVEKRLNDSVKDLTEAEEELKGFQEKNGAVKLDVQSQAMLSAIGSLKGGIMAKEVELQTLLSYASSSSPEVQLITEELKGLRSKVQELESGRKKTDTENTTLFIPSSRYPGLGLQYARLLRKLKVQQTLYEMLTKQYEMAKIQEAKDSPTVQILDRPIVPEKRSKPKRSLIVMLSTILGLFCSVFLVFLLEARDKWRLNVESTLETEELSHAHTATHP